MTQNLTHRINGLSPAVLSLFRLVYGFLFAMHGSAVLFGWPVAFGHPTPFLEWPGWYAGAIELVTGTLVAVGLFTRIGAFFASGTMAVAYFWIHQPIALWPIGEPPMGNGGTPAILYCFGFFLLVFMGPGRYALDPVVSTKLPRRKGRSLRAVRRRAVR